MRRLHPFGRNLAPTSIALTLWLISAGSMALAMGGAGGGGAGGGGGGAGGELEGEEVVERAEAVVAGARPAEVAAAWEAVTAAEAVKGAAARGSSSRSKRSAPKG